jgi:hypothetical protein
MHSSATLRSIASARIQDAETLFASGRSDGASYICGYAVELTLKARICDTLNWSGFPETPSEFKNLLSFKTHNLDVLLALSGKEPDIKSNNFSDWSIVSSWNPEARYQAVGNASPADVSAFIESAKRLLAAI